MKQVRFNTRRIVGLLFVTCVSLYLLQMAMVAYWEFIPMEREEMGGIRYELRRGFGFPVAFIPLVGATPVVLDEPVRLTMTDLTSGQMKEEDYDVPYDVFSKYGEVWPGKAKP